MKCICSRPESRRRRGTLLVCAVAGFFGLITNSCWFGARVEIVVTWSTVDDFASMHIATTEGVSKLERGGGTYGGLVRRPTNGVYQLKADTWSGTQFSGSCVVTNNGKRLRTVVIRITDVEAFEITCFGYRG